MVRLAEGRLSAVARKDDHRGRRWHLGFAVALWLAVRCAWSSEPWPDERMLGPFVCHADYSMVGQEPLLGQIGALRRDVAQALDLPTSNEPIHLFLFERRGTYQNYLRLYFPDVPDRRALFIKHHRGPGMVFAYCNDELAIDVRHECTHAVLHSQLPMVPLWLDEGLAEYFEMPPAERAAGNPHHATVRRQTLWGSVPALSRLEGLAHLEQMGTSEYRGAWAWVHFMLHGPAPAREELVRYLQDISAQVPPGRLSERLQRRIPDLDSQFLTHFRRWKL